MPVWWAMPILGMGGAAAGHVTGRMVAAHRASERDAPAKEKLSEAPADDDWEAAPPGGVEIAAPASIAY